MKYNQQHLLKFIEEKIEQVNWEGRSKAASAILTGLNRYQELEDLVSSKIPDNSTINGQLIDKPQLILQLWRWANGEAAHLPIRPPVDYPREWWEY